MDYALSWKAGDPPFRSQPGAPPTYIVGAHGCLSVSPWNGLALLFFCLEMEGRLHEAVPGGARGGPPRAKERRPIKPAARDETKRRQVQVGKATAR